MSETVNDCQVIQCTNENDIDIYSLQSLPPIAPITPAGAGVGNDELTYCCDTGDTIDYYGTLPAWLILDRSENCLRAVANSYWKPTKAEANAEAQAALDDFVADALADDTLACISGDPTLETTIAGLGGGAPAQSAWDEDNQFVWTSFGWDGSTRRISRVNVNDNSVASFDPGSTTNGIQYISTFDGALQDERLWFNQATIAGHFLTASPYTKTNVFTGMAGNITSSLVAPMLWIPEKNILIFAQGVVSSKLRVSAVNFVTGLRTQSDLTGVTSDEYNYAYNPEQNEFVVGGLARVNVDTLSPTVITLAGGRNQSHCSEYCPDNGFLYVPYSVGATYGVALIYAATGSIYAYVDISTSAITGILYHSARRYMYIYGLTRISIIDTTKFDLGAAMIIGSITGLPTNITRASGVYCPLTRKAYIAVSGGSMYVVT